LVQTPASGGLTHTDKPLQPLGHRVEGLRGKSIACATTSTVSHHHPYPQPLRERTRWEGTRPGSILSLAPLTLFARSPHAAHPRGSFPPFSPAALPPPSPALPTTARRSCWTSEPGVSERLLRSPSGLSPRRLPRAGKAD